MSKNKSLAKRIQDNPFDIIAQASNSLELKSAVHPILPKPENSQDELLKRIQGLIKKFLNNPRDKEDFLKQLQENLNKYLEMTAVENGLYLEFSIHKFDQKHVLPVRQNLIEEYKATTFSELLIIDLAINAYFRALRSGSIYNVLAQDKEGTISWPDQQKINLIKEVGKQIEMANRQFLTAMTYLKEFRQQPLNIKVQTKSAFIARNQQFNKNA